MVRFRSLPLRAGRISELVLAYSLEDVGKEVWADEAGWASDAKKQVELTNNPVQSNVPGPINLM